METMSHLGPESAGEDPVIGRVLLDPGTSHVNPLGKRTLGPEELLDLIVAVVVAPPDPEVVQHPPELLGDVPIRGGACNAVRLLKLLQGLSVFSP